MQLKSDKESSNGNGKNKKKSLKIYICVILAIFGLFSGAIYMQYKTMLKLEVIENQLESEIEEQNKRFNELTEQSKYRDSDEYIEKIAREQLGFVKPNEKLFIDQNK